MVLTGVMHIQSPLPLWNPFDFFFRTQFAIYVMRSHWFMFTLLIAPIWFVFLCLIFSLSLQGRNEFLDGKGSCCPEMFITCSPKREKRGRGCWGGTSGKNSSKLQAGLLWAGLQGRKKEIQRLTYHSLEEASRQNSRNS